MHRPPPCPPYRGRFAPSPTGPLHLGSLVAALGSWLLAEQAGGQWWLRMEDLDPPREVAGAAQQQLATLHALGFRPAGPLEWQSRRSALYQTALERLLDEGKAFACHCSRSDLAASQGIHHRCRTGALRPDPAVRLRVAPGTVISFEDGLQGTVRQDVHAEVGDFVLRRADRLWAYQLAVVIDDADQGMTDIVRGADLVESTPRQILLQRALGLPTPRYLHLPLVVDAQGDKLSKSSAAPAVDAHAPLPALRAAWLALGQQPAALSVCSDGPSFLRSASTLFEPMRLPRRHSIPVAALHNTADTNAD